MSVDRHCLEKRPDVERRVPVSIRVSATAMDWVIVAMLFHLCGWIAGDLGGGAVASVQGKWSVGINGSIIGWITALAYFSTEVPLRQTVGKMCFGIAVASRTLERLTLSRRLIRYAVKNLCVLGAAAALLLDAARTALNADGAWQWCELIAWAAIVAGLLLAAISVVLVVRRRPAMHDLLAGTKVLERERATAARGFSVE